MDQPAFDNQETKISILVYIPSFQMNVLILERNVFSHHQWALTQ